MPDPQNAPTVGDLLLKALDTLPEDERRQVLSALLTSSALPPSALRRLHTPTSDVDVQLATARLLAGERGRQRVDLVPLPVRLPTADYERLKAWCAEHDFPMAVVIRGLVERFLDDQQVPRAA